MFFAACGVIRGPGYSTFEISMSQEVKKAPFVALTFESVVLFTCYQRWFIGQSLRENFFPMRNTLDRSYRDRHLTANGENY